MNALQENIIKQFLKKNPRNRLIIGSTLLDGIPYCDMGVELAPKLLPFLNDSRLSFKAKEIVGVVIKLNTQDTNGFQDIVGLSNVGILLEKELKFDFTNLIESVSQNTTVVLHWPGEIVDRGLYFLTKDHGIRIDLSSLSYITI